MKVRVAPSAGFCMGVRRAMDRVLDVARGRERTYTIGPLIHNPQALEMLETRNVTVAKTLDETLEGETVVIRAHGVPPETYRRLEEIGAMVVDATCPKVFRSQGIIKKFVARGYDVVIVGDRGHAETDALMGLAGDRGIMVETVAEARALPPMEKVCVVAQTTLNIGTFTEIVEEIEKHAGDCHVANTICASTERRQKDVRRLADETDATVVVGGRNSANTSRLAEISRELGQPTYLIETPEDLDLEELSRYGEIGVTAGASTPQWVLQQVVDAIADYTPRRSNPAIAFLKRAVFLAVEGNIIACLAASALTAAMCRLMAIPPQSEFLAMSFFYLFPMHTVNKYLEINWKSVPATGSAFMRKYWHVFLVMALLSSLIALGIAWRSGVFIVMLVAVSYLLAGLYSVRIIPPEWHIRFKSLRDIPGSKDVLIATGWTFAVVVLPAITHESFPGLIALAGGVYVFTLVFSKATIIAIGGMQSDKLVGQETIPVLIGVPLTERLLYTLNGLLAVIFVLLTMLGALSPLALVLLLPIGYMVLCIPLMGRRRLTFRSFHLLALDADFILAGALALLFMS